MENCLLVLLVGYGQIQTSVHPPCCSPPRVCAVLCLACTCALALLALEGRELGAWVYPWNLGPAPHLLCSWRLGCPLASSWVWLWGEQAGDEGERGQRVGVCTLPPHRRLAASPCSRLHHCSARPPSPGSGDSSLLCAFGLFRLLLPAPGHCTTLCWSLYTLCSAL